MAKSIYIHIPFCVRKCLYCDFTSYSGQEGVFSEYVEALKSEVGLYATRFPGTSISTVYFGGGTPNVLADAQLADVMKEVARGFDFERDAEVTVEANPGVRTGEDGRRTFDYLHSHRFNRLSLGIQSFHDDELALLGRLHTAQEAVRAFESARQSGFENISIDLMYGIPGQTLDSWLSTLDSALQLGSEHISLYSLTVEEGTPFFALQNAGRLELPGDDAEADMYEAAIAALTGAGYVHYEVSNFARPGFECRHNMTYWRNEPYFGFGAGAVGYLGGSRMANTRDVGEYIARVRAGELPTETFERLAGRGSMGETMFLGLRMMQGVDTRAFESRYGVTPEMVFGTELARMSNDGLVESSHGFIRLTNKGLMLANEVFMEFV